MKTFVIVLVILSSLIAPPPVWAGGASPTVGLALGAFDVAVRAVGAVMAQPATGNVILDGMVLADNVLHSAAQLGNVLPGRQGPALRVQEAVARVGDEADSRWASHRPAR